MSNSADCGIQSGFGEDDDAPCGVQLGAENAATSDVIAHSAGASSSSLDCGVQLGESSDCGVQLGATEDEDAPCGVQLGAE